MSESIQYHIIKMYKQKCFKISYIDFKISYIDFISCELPSRLMRFLLFKKNRNIFVVAILVSSPLTKTDKGERFQCWRSWGIWWLLPLWFVCRIQHSPFIHNLVFDAILDHPLLDTKFSIVHSTVKPGVGDIWQASSKMQLDINLWAFC